MGIKVTHTPAFATFTGSSKDLAPIIAQLREAAIAFEQTGEQIAVDLQAQGEGPMAIQKGAFVLDLVDLYSSADEGV
jgi:hypothetical protein